MKVRRLEDGEELQVGDRIKRDSRGIGGTYWETVHRVTKVFAFVRYNEHAEGKYRRKYQDFGFGPVPRPKWSRTQYSAWRPVVS